MTLSRPWWLNAVFYRIDVRSFADSDADAIGDLDGLRARLGYLELLGVTALAIGEADLGANPESAHFLIEEAHEAGIRVIIDLPTGTDPRDWLERGVDGLQLTSDDATARAMVDEYPGRVLVGGGHLAFTPYLAGTAFDADSITDTILDGLAVTDSVPAWSLAGWSNGHSPGELDPEHARALALVQLALPGAACLWHGEELGLPGGVRTPMPWEGDVPPFGFSEADGSWLSIPEEWATRTVEAQLEDPSSTLSLYRRALELRAEHRGGESVEWFGAPAECFAFQLSEGGLTCALNSSMAPVPLPPGTVLISSTAPSEEIEHSGELPPRTAVWLA